MASCKKRKYENEKSKGLFFSLSNKVGTEPTRVNRKTTHRNPDKCTAESEEESQALQMKTDQTNKHAGTSIRSR